jgi:hypothetical protein
MSIPSHTNHSKSATNTTCTKPKRTTNSQYTIGQIVRQFGNDYVKKYQPNERIIKTLQHIANCRTPALGGHLVQCSACGYQKINYNSCGDSNCPNCQNIKKELWIDKISHHLLPIKHFHIIFTVPHQLNDLFFYNQRKMYKLFFHAAWQTIQSVTGKGDSGMVATLHTWGSNLSYHPHIHGIVPKGSLVDKDWQMGQAIRFFVKSELLRNTFKSIFLKKLLLLIEKEKLRLQTTILSKQDFEKIKQIYHKINRLKWSVRIESPILGVQQIIEYLGRYVKRVAITNSRITGISNKKVVFEYNDYAKQKTGKPAPKASISLNGEAFLQRFTQHILPSYFQRVRYFGIYAFTNKKKKSTAFCSIQGQPQVPYQKPNKRVLIKKMLGIDPDVCPTCACYMTLTTEIIAENKDLLYFFKTSKSKSTWSHQATLFKMRPDLENMAF